MATFIIRDHPDGTSSGVWTADPDDCIDCAGTGQRTVSLGRGRETTAECDGCGGYGREQAS